MGPRDTSGVTAHDALSDSSSICAICRLSCTVDMATPRQANRVKPFDRGSLSLAVCAPLYDESTVLRFCLCVSVSRRLSHVNFDRRVAKRCEFTIKYSEIADWKNCIPSLKRMLTVTSSTTSRMDFHQKTAQRAPAHLCTVNRISHILIFHFRDFPRIFVIFFEFL